MWILNLLPFLFAMFTSPFIYISPFFRHILSTFQLHSRPSTDLLFEGHRLQNIDLMIWEELLERVCLHGAAASSIFIFEILPDLLTEGDTDHVKRSWTEHQEEMPSGGFSIQNVL